MPEMSPEEKRSKRIEIGNSLKEFSRTFAGQFLTDLWDQQVAITCSDMAFKKKAKDRDAPNEPRPYECQTEGDFREARGFARGVKWVLDDFEGRIKTAKRLEEERIEEEKRKGDS